MKLDRMAVVFAGLVLSVAVIAKDQDMSAAREQSALSATVQACAACHGVNGRSISPTFPNLAAQMPGYIETQLKAFKEQTRSDPDAQAYMWGMAAPLSDAQIHGLADYFGKQSAAAGKPGDPVLIERGRHVFEEGFPRCRYPPVRAVMVRSRRAWRSFRVWPDNMPPIC